METNIIAPVNGWLEDEFPFGMASWQVRTVSFFWRVITTKEKDGPLFCQRWLMLIEGLNQVVLPKSFSIFFDAVDGSIAWIY